MGNLDDIKNNLERLGGGKKAAPQTEKLNKSGKSVVRGKNGGARPGAGRKPNEAKLIERGIKAEIDKYAREPVEMEVQDPKTGQKRKIIKPRIMWVLETYFNVGMKLLAEKQDLAAAGILNGFLDRALGKAAQPIRGEGEDDAPIKIGVSVLDILRKGYGNQD